MNKISVLILLIVFSGCDEEYNYKKQEIEDFLVETDSKLKNDTFLLVDRYNFSRLLRNVFFVTDNHVGYYFFFKNWMTGDTTKYEFSAQKIEDYQCIRQIELNTHVELRPYILLKRKNEKMDRYDVKGDSLRVYDIAKLLALPYCENFEEPLDPTYFVY